MSNYIPVFQDDEHGLKIQLFQKNSMPCIAGRFKVPIEIYENNDKQLHRILVLVAQCGGYAYSETLFSDIVSFEEDILIKDEFANGVFTFNVFSYLESMHGIYYLHMSIDKYLSEHIEIKKLK